MEAIMTSTEREAVCCPFGCLTVGYTQIPRLITHFMRNHVPNDISDDRMNAAKAWLDRNKHESVANKWRGIVQLVLPNLTNTPSPFIHTGTQYLRAIRQPHFILLSILRLEIENGSIREPCPNFLRLPREQQDAVLIGGPLAAMEVIILYLDRTGMVYGTES